MSPPGAPSSLEARLSSLVSSGGGAQALLAELGAVPRAQADAALAGLASTRVLGALLRVVVEGGRYEALRALCTAEATRESPGLRALAACRPDWDEAALNAPAQRLVRAGRLGGPYPFAVLIIPGYTPLDAREPIALTDVGRLRCDLARYHYETGRAGLLLPSGGAVHPAGTRYCEAIEMRRHLVASGVPEERVLVDPYARHSTTNLRNAGRLLLDLGIRRAGIVTGGESRAFAQDFYFAHPVVSTFHLRCRAELGYEVGRLEEAGEHLIAFEPSEDVRRPLWSDPLDV